MTIEFNRSPELIIDDLSFRAGWLERSFIDNIKRLKALADRDLAPVDVLRQAVADLAVDSEKLLTELQIQAAARLQACNEAAAARAGTATILPFSADAPTSAKLAKPTMVPA